MGRGVAVCMGEDRCFTAGVWFCLQGIVHPEGNGMSSLYKLQVRTCSHADLATPYSRVIKIHVHSTFHSTAALDGALFNFFVLLINGFFLKQFSVR